ncbi:nucleotide exchange factor GrpE [Streptomyces sp. NPDC091281]|uniref:nucleotide exchange factor GrpE n=1 Tax=Streptomyces sp. NPDC091281 TaxID=3365985 RepID=UPI00380501F9
MPLPESSSVPRPPDPRVPVLSPTAPEVSEPGGAAHGTRDPDIDAAVAEAVLDVADRIRSAHLRRGLAQALTRLPDVTVIAPPAGTPFDPDRHEAVDTVPTDRPELADTVAENLMAGLADRTGRIVRPARVTVHVVERESP